MESWLGSKVQSERAPILLYTNQSRDAQDQTPVESTFESALESTLEPTGSPQEMRHDIFVTRSRE